MGKTISVTLGASLTGVTHLTGTQIRANTALVGYGAAGVTLGMMTPVSGFTISSPGVYEFLDVSGSLIVASGVTGVTIQKCRITATADNNNAINILGRTNPSASDVVVQYCEINSSGVGDVVFAGDLGGYTAYRNNVHGGGDGFRANDNITISENWIHGLGNPFPDPHSDGIQRYSGRGRNWTVTGNWIYNDDPVGPVSCIMIGSEIQDMEGPILVDSNAFAGGTYAFYYDAPESVGTVTNNDFWTDLPWSGPANTSRSPAVQFNNKLRPAGTNVPL